jgi:hypothetical protein
VLGHCNRHTWTLDWFGDSDRTAFVEVDPGIEFRMVPCQKDSVVDAFAAPVVAVNRTEIEHQNGY